MSNRDRVALCSLEYFKGKLVMIDCSRIKRERKYVVGKSRHVPESRE